MATIEAETKEARIRKLFQAMTFEIGIGVFFLGLGAQSAVIHSGQAMHYGYSDPLNIAILMDTGLFFIAAAAVTKGIKSLTHALMLLAEIEPELKKKKR